ncbi:MAG: class I SAM-dependent methyltransferase [Verrucomicrobia bacterium]|nr:class I SAM-dependent methyltransferase [Verrucomicrobiota bacterium]
MTPRGKEYLKTDPRPFESIRRHYEVEKELAQRLLHSTRAERTRLFATLYGELFRRVPDHPRLTRRDTPERSRAAVAGRMALLRGQLSAEKTFLEFAPGDCRLAFEVCAHVRKVIGVDISDQSSAADRRPDNFELVVYDGYNLGVPDESVDVVFSYQFIEHLHPEDVMPHFEMARRVLRPGGVYVFSTPHAFSGPHDISSCFSDQPECFHFKEWTFTEMAALLRGAGFSQSRVFRRGRVREGWLVNQATLCLEDFFRLLPSRLRNHFSRRLFNSVVMLARK